MPKNSSTRFSKPSTSSFVDDRRDGDGRDGKEVGNLILRSLPRKEFAQIFPLLEFLRLQLHQVLHEPGENIRSGYFLNNGLGSVLTTQPDGKTVEVGLIGKEGFVGLPVVFGFKTSGLRVVTQGEGTAYRIDVDSLLKLLPKCPDLEKQLQRFSLILGMQSTQLAACNRLHDVVERLATVAVDEPGPHRRPDPPIDPGVPVSNARYPPRQRDRGCRKPAERRTDSLLPRQRQHSRSHPTRVRRLRLL